MDIEILAQKFCDYALSIRGYSKDTIRRYKYMIGCFSKFTGIANLSDVNEEKIRQLFYMGRTERKWTTNTFIVYHKTLLVFFRWCVKQGYMEKNPMLDIEKPKLEKKLPTKLSQQTTLRLLEIVYNFPYEYKFLRYRNHATFATFIFAGLRKQELLNLKFTDIDLDNLPRVLLSSLGIIVAV